MVLTGGRLNIGRALEEVNTPWISVSPFQPGILNPDEAQTITVWVNPEEMATGQWIGLISLMTNDPLRPTHTLKVVADIQECGSLSISPTSLNFGDNWIDQSSSIYVTLHNTCKETTMIHSIFIDHEAFHHDAITPFVVPSFGSVTFSVQFIPTNGGAQSGSLIIISNADNNPLLAISVEGRGILPPYEDIEMLPLPIELDQQCFLSVLNP